MSDLLRLGIAGVHGHGRSHVEAALARSSGVELVAVADPRGGGDVPPATRQYAGAVDMIDAGGLDLVVICTPFPTHADLTLRALTAGFHVLLEKPPVVSVAEHDLVRTAAASAGRAVQVGFQSLGSTGVDAARDLASSGAIGDLEHIGAVGLWSRSEEYWRRSTWSGRRFADDGTVVADGAVTNPLAHAVATALAIGGARAPHDVAGIRADLRRANDIETDDTSSLVIDLSSGIRVAAALALTAPRRHEPYVLLRGSRGYAIYFYTLDLLQVHVGTLLPRTYEFARVGLLANLVAHVRGEAPLAVPLADTGAFTRVLEEVTSGPPPARIAADDILVQHRNGGVFRVVRGVEERAERSAWEGKLFSELGA